MSLLPDFAMFAGRAAQEAKKNDTTGKEAYARRVKPMKSPAPTAICALLFHQTHHLRTGRAPRKGDHRGRWAPLLGRARTTVSAAASCRWTASSSGRPSKGKGRSSPLGLAGIWENWKEPASREWLRMFAVISTNANELVGSSA
jgi:putative SOS response-associated peptidase YedK